METEMSVKRLVPILASLLLVVFIFVGCYNTTQNETMTKEQDLFKFGIQTIEHDGCEYVIFKDNGRSDVEMLHKQNCKFCAESSKK